MIQTKYLIIAGVVICLIILYYFYDEIKNVKKLFTPAYQKTMALEAKVLELEKITATFAPQKSSKKRNDSPALSITYQSDMIKRNGNLSVKYADISETEAKELLKNIEQNRRQSSQSSQPLQSSQPSQISMQLIKEPERKIHSENFSDFDRINLEPSNIQGEETDTINFKISDLINKNPVNSDVNEYQKILDVLSNKISPSNSIFDNQMEIDEDVIKHISESIHYADLSSETLLSDIPGKKITSKNKKSLEGKKTNKK